MIRRRNSAVLFAGILAVAGLAIAQTAPAAKPPKTTICHETHSATKPYAQINVGKAVLKGHMAHPGDIIPAPAGGCPATVLTASKGGKKLSTTLTGAAEVPGPGDPDGTGTASLRLRKGQGEICFKLTVSNITLPAAAAHIHKAPAGVAGPIVVGLTAPDADGSVEGCVSAPRALVKDIMKHSSEYYVNVHTSDYPAGAVRGQL
jgi:CHRD domain